MKVIPNPFTESAYLVFDNKDNNKYRLAIYNTEGKIVADKKTAEEKIVIEKGNLRPGLYFFKLIPIEKGVTYSGKFIIK